MSEKIVKVTNGKILNYKISASGYKTIYGSKFISANTTITKNMISGSDPNGVYSVGDRLGNIASFVCYYTDSNNKQYAVFVLDAQYRQNPLFWGPEYPTGLQTFSDGTILTQMQNNPISATYCNNYIVQNFTLSDFPAFELCNNIVYNPLNLTAKLPNPYELYNIFLNRVELDTFDPTLTSYSSLGLSSWKTAYSCYESNNPTYYCWTWKLVVSDTYMFKDEAKHRDGDGYFVIPIFEVPIE